jgi:hypothetical protein
VEVFFHLPRVPFKQAVGNVEGFMLLERFRLFPVYHCGRRMLNTHRPLAEQQKDWLRIERALLAG